MHQIAILMAEWSWTFETPVVGGPFDLRAALIVFAVATVAAAVIISAAILMPGIGIVAGTSLLKTCIEVGTIALVTGIIAGGAAGRYQGLKTAREEEQERIEYIWKIREVDHYLDVFFLPSSDVPENARDFVCVLVEYDAGMPDSPVLKTQIETSTADTFYEEVRSQLDRWVRRPIILDGGRRRHVAIFMRPYPGDGVYDRIRQLCLERAEIETSRVDGQWRSRLKDVSSDGTVGDTP